MAKRLQIALVVMLALCLTVTVLVFVACSPDHVHTFGPWQEEVAPTCLQEGKKTRTCTECFKVESEVIEPLGHAWDDGEVTEDPTCEGEGSMLYTCTRVDCAETSTASIDPLGHDWQEEREILAPTCEEPGLRSAVCSRCDEREDEQIVLALGHKWDDGIQIKAPDCEKTGEKLFTCTRDKCSATDTRTLNALGHLWGAWQRTLEPDCTTKGSEKHTCSRTDCNKTETRSVDALGHSLSYDYTIDKQPTTEEPGSKSRHCTREGCDGKGDVQTIPKLDKTTLLNYKITITDPCGLPYRGVGTVSFYDSDGLVSYVQITTSSYGSANVSLGTNNYKVRVTGLNDGYSAEAEYDVMATNPNLTIKLSTALNTGTKPSLPFYKTGSILYDQEYSYFDTNGELQTTRISDILKVKKGILLNFYFYGCPPCNSEMAALIAASKEFASDVQVIMVNYHGYGDTDETILSFQDKHSAKGTPLWFLNAASSKSLYTDFASVVKTFPQSAYIDCNGQVVSIDVGQSTQSQFRSMMQAYIVNRYATLRPSETLKNDTKVTNDYTIVAILPTVKFD